jgi:hypothetical protein
MLLFGIFGFGKIEFVWDLEFRIWDLDRGVRCRGGPPEAVSKIPQVL